MMFYQTKILAYFALIKHLLSASITNDTLQCFEVNNPNKVAFETLHAYKSNRISFDPIKSDYSGNYVEIIEKLPNLTAGMFLTYESTFIIKLSLSEREVRTIQPRAFIGLPCLHYLRLRRNKIARISNGIFDGLNNLLELSLDSNRLTDIPANVFSCLISLQTLDLSNNKLSTIDSSQFKLLPTLKHLDISYNNLHTISRDAFSELGFLVKLNLSYNQLRKVPVEFWQHLNTLKSFILTGNELSTFNLESAYKYKSVVYLYLDSNRFKHLQIEQIKLRYPKLLLLELQDNPWNCDDLFALIAILNATKITFTHKNSTDTNVNGLDCIDYSTSTPLFNSTSSSNTLDSSSNVPAVGSSSNASASNSTSECCENCCHIDDRETIYKIKSISICILLLVVLLLVVDFIVRCGILENLNRATGCGYRRSDIDQAESIRLLNTRSGL